MKYVKLFESWLNEAEGEDGIKSFNKEEPRDWPVMKTTIKMLYSGAGGTIDGGVLESILGRANQSGKKFDKAAEIRLIGLGDTYGPTVKNDGRLGIKGDGASTGKTYKEVQQMLKNIAKPDAVESNVSTIKNLKAFAITDGREIPAGDQIALTASSEPGMCLIVIPRNIKDIRNNPNSEVINMNIMVIFDGNAYTTLMGNLLAFIKNGLDTAQFFTEKDQYANVSAIFAGETAGSLIAFEKTIGEKKFYAAKRGDEDTNDIKMKARDGLFITTAEGTEYIGQILFEFDKAELTEEAKKILNSKDLRIACDDAKETIKIVGHADGKGDAEYNKKLSMQRAESVLNYLKTLGWWKNSVEASVTTEGMGSTVPVMNDKKGTDPIASSINRRVEFIIDGNKPNYEKIKSELTK